MTDAEPVPTPIADYALIGDCQSAALVSRTGSIDWLCLPRFDSPACFAALLGTPENGRWQIAPAADVVETRRAYRDGTLVLETTFVTSTGTVRLVDFMPPRTALPNVMRIVEGIEGSVPMRLDLTIRFDYGSVVPWLRRRRGGGIRAIAGPETLYLRSDVPLDNHDLRTASEFVVEAGAHYAFDLAWVPSHRPEPAVSDPLAALRSTEASWREWSGRSTYAGEWKAAVQRSLIVLKALTYAPTGGIVAAVTTSLPEHRGGVRNWDYRYCWIRDATFTLYALMTGGYVDEARAWRQWLVHAVAGTPAEMQIMYGIAGERRLTEVELDWLPGYAGSRPVRTGNAAYSQRQLDVYGELMDSMLLARRLGLPEHPDAWRIQTTLLQHLETAWREPDEGIWEMRGPRRHFTHSKVMAWVAFDRGIKMAEQFALEGPLDRWRAVRQEIHDEVCRLGFNPAAGAFTQFYGSADPDASLLMLALVGFLPPDDERIRGTVALVEAHLLHDGLVQRYPTRPSVDALPAGEGTFLICSFWLVDNLVLLGRMDEARRLFERLLALRNDVGLLAEEYDPSRREFLGNFPQAFSHVGLINSARNLADAGGPAKDRPSQ